MPKLKNMLLLCGLGCAVAVSGCGVPRGPLSVSSPDGSVVFRLALEPDEEGTGVTYAIEKNGVPVIGRSSLGIGLDEREFPAQAPEIAAVENESVDESYENGFGKRKTIRNNYNEMIVSLKESGPEGRQADLIIRAFDDGAAFRYYFPATDRAEEWKVTGEYTEFTMPGDPRVFALPLNSYTSNYETNYEIIPLSEVRAGSILGLPLLAGLQDGLWAAITEASLTDYAGMYLIPAEGRQGVLVSSLSPRPDNPGVMAEVELPCFTPWRVVMIAADPGKLIESDIVMNLNEPCALDDVSWIKPGKAAWDWWSGQVVKGTGFTGGMNTATMKYYADFAAEAGLEYLLIDAGWYGDHRSIEADITRSIPEVDIPEIVRHAGARGVGIALWLNWHAVDRQMDQAFPLYEKWGIRGVKIDYMDRDDQEMVDFYSRVVRKAAEHHLLVDFHGAYKPTGLRRTYPNLITREGVLGLEYNKWSARCHPEHDVTIPFTRMLAGPMDYTPGAFANAAKDDFEARRAEPMSQGTRCHQLAMFVVYESPFQMLADHPANYREQAGLEFIKQAPTVWDETTVINAWPADYITIARRKDGVWFVGSMTDWDPRELDIPLAFLGAGDWVAEIYADAPDAREHPEHATRGTYLVTSATVLKAALAPGGGHAVVLRRSPEGSSYPRYGE